MRLVWIATAIVSLLASCKDHRDQKAREAPPSPSATPAAQAPAAATSPLDVCRISVVAIDQATCTAPEGRQKLRDAKKALDGVVETIGKIGGADSRQFQVMCAQMLLAIEPDAAKLGCAVAIDASQRKEITALLDAWYGQRTPVVPTGDAAADAVITKISAVRDATCACRDAACLDRVDKQLVAIGTLPAAAPDAARTLGSKLLEDAQRCASRARTLGDPPR
jgi:hypothetical protein